MNVYTVLGCLTLTAQFSNYTQCKYSSCGSQSCTVVTSDPLQERQAWWVLREREAGVCKDCSNYWQSVVWRDWRLSSNVCNAGPEILIISLLPGKDTRGRQLIEVLEMVDYGQVLLECWGLLDQLLVQVVWRDKILWSEMWHSERCNPAPPWVRSLLMVLFDTINQTSSKLSFAGVT